MKETLIDNLEWLVDIPSVTRDEQRIADLMGHATVVMFSPEDLRIVRDGPAARRRFVDMQLSQIRSGYVRALKTYLSVLESRNALLRQDKLQGVSDFANQLDAYQYYVGGLVPNATGLPLSGFQLHRVWIGDPS